jgi:Fe-S cluster assembly protein SufD
VSEGAQRTDAYQANRNLLLSDQARADSIPGLEILANDVRCTHGATIGHVDDEQMYYLRSRGLPAMEAQRLIVEGFFVPVLDRIPLEGVREGLRHAIQRKIG